MKQLICPKISNMPEKIDFSVAERFMRYVKIDTQSDPSSNIVPSTVKQLDLSRLLVKELQAMGAADIELDHNGYVYASIPATNQLNSPVICLCAHVDTAPDCTGTNVKPILHRNYDGSDIILPDDPTQVITTAEHPYLLEKIGDDIITASGTTLLGADDKAGVAVIMAAAEYLLKHPEIPHGLIRLLFTPDEEIGRGVNYLDMQTLGADFGYTLDAGECGTFEDETFSADGVSITFHGVSAHPGYARDKLINAIKAAAAFLQKLPAQEWSPETTAGRDGFVHPVRIEGNAEKATVEFIIRDFDTAKLVAYEERLKELLEATLDEFVGVKADFTVREQYRNMKEMLDQYPQVSALAEEAIRRAGLTLKKSSARGGTDGSRLSFMGLPCPNLFTGEMAFHGKHEYVSVEDMQKSAQVLIELVQLWGEQQKS
jgi:tripeptide aminopeptidase